jgi:ABC-2 type transport system ATP-binding protein
MNVIEVTHLKKYFEFYRKKPGLWGSVASFFNRTQEYAKAVDDISFSITEGEIVGFLGPNGAGKTTTLKMLSGILYPSEGSCRVLGFDPYKKEKAFQKQFGIVMGQKDQLMRALTPMDNFLLFKEFGEVTEEDFSQILDELVDILDVRDFLHVQVKKLSLGQKMKCELIAALLHNPRILFLDEPTIGLDVVAQKNVRDFIKKYNVRKKTTILLTSHYMDDIRELCERVIIINHGKIAYDGSIDALISTYATYKVIRITTTAPIIGADIQKFGEVEECNNLQASIRVDRREVRDVSAHIISSDLPIADISIQEPAIDDIVRIIFGQKEVE